MCSWQQVTARLADGHSLASYASLGPSSGNRVSNEAAGEGIKPSHADLHVINQACSEQARQITSSSPRTDVRHAAAQAGFENSSGQPTAEVAKASRKRAAHTSFAEPATKKFLRGENSDMQLLGNHSHGQGSSAVAGAVSTSLVVDAAAAAVPTSSGGSDSRAAQHGSGAGAAEMAEGMASGRRRVVKRKGRALKLVKEETDMGDEGLQAMDAC